MGKRKKRKTGTKKFAFWRFLGRGIRSVFKIFPLAVLIFLGGAIFWSVRQVLYADSHLVVGKILVEPAEALPAALREALENRLIGKNILKVDVAAVSREIEKNPEILQAKVVRQFPSQLKISLQVRRPVAVIQFAPKGNFGLVSEDGLVLDVLAKPDPTYLFIESYGEGIKEIPMGFRVKNKGFYEAARFIKNYQDHSLAKREPLTRISLDPFGNVTLTLRMGPPIRMGRRPNDHLKALEKIEPLLAGEERDKIDYMDLQFDNVIVKRKNK